MSSESSGPTIECGCGQCPDGVPVKFKLTFSGVINGGSTCCDAINGADILLDRLDACTWWTTSGPCGSSFYLKYQGGNMYVITGVEAPQAKWQWNGTGGGMPECGCLAGPYVLENIEAAEGSSNFCKYPANSEVVVTAIPNGLTKDDPSAWHCNPSMQPGPNATGYLSDPLAPLYLGQTTPSSVGQPPLFPYL